MTANAIFTSDITETHAKTFFADTFSSVLTTSNYDTLPGTKVFEGLIAAENEGYTAIGDTEGVPGFMAKIDGIRNKPTDRTVYMDSNIALTDGRNRAKDGARVIPNLFDTIEGLKLGEEILARKVEQFQSEHRPSTADGGLFVDFLTAESEENKALQHADSTKDIFRLSPAKIDTGAGITDRTAKEANHAVGLNFDADEISFTVTNRNKTIEAWSISEFVRANYDIPDDVMKLDDIDNFIFYWVPLDSEHKPSDGVIPEGAAGKIMFGKANSPVTEYVSQTTVEKEGGVAYTAGSDKETVTIRVTERITYNIGAIVEAIQELNRRTMFMDTDMSFNSTLCYADYVSDCVNGAV